MLGYLHMLYAFCIFIFSCFDEAKALQVTSPAHAVVGSDASFSIQLSPYPSNESTISIRKNSALLMRVKGTTSRDVAKRFEFTGNTFENRIYFILRNVALGDAGIYTATESIDESGEQKLIVKASPSKPQIIVLTGPAVSGSNYRLKCYAMSNSAPPDHGLIMISQWKVNNQIIALGGHYYVQGTELFIDRLKYGQDNGAKLTCVSYEDSLVQSIPSIEHTIYVKFTSPVQTFVGSTAMFNLKLDPYPSNDSIIRIIKDGVTLLLAKGTMFRNYSNRFEFTGNTNENNISFILRNVTLEDAGIYIATEIDGSYVEQQLIVKASPSRPEIIALTGSAVSESDYRLNCSSTSNSAPPDHGMIMISEWKLNDQLITTGGHYEVLGTEFTIVSLVKQDNGAKLTCVAYEDSLAKSVSSNDYVMDVKYGPDNVELSPSSRIIMEIEGRMIIIRCTADCNPACSFRWRRDSVPAYLEENQMLMIDGVGKGDADNYTCIVSNSITGRSQHIQTQLVVIYGPDNIQLNPSSGIIVVVEHRLITILCTADCNPACSFQWRRESFPGYLKTNQTLMIDNVGKNDSDNYTCTVSNSINGRFQIIQTLLVVLSAPEILYMSPSYKGYIGRCIMIQFDFYSNTEGNLTVTARQFNSYGSMHRGSIRPTHRVNLPVYSSNMSVPRFRATINICITSENHFGLYDVEVNNSIGSDSRNVKIVEQIAPEKPTNLHATNIEEKQLSLMWLSGYDGGFAQTFAIEISRDNMTWNNVSLVSAGETEGWFSVIVGDLIPGSQYYLRLYAYNVNGRGDIADVQLAIRTLKGYPCSSSLEVGASFGIGVGGSVLGLAGAIIAIIIRRRINAATNTSIRSNGNMDAEVFTYSNTEFNPQIPNPMYEELHRGNAERNVYDQIA